MQVEQRTRIAAIEHLTHTLHGDAIECDIVEIETVDFFVLHQPVQPFDVKVVPSRDTAVHHGRIFDRGHMPRRDVVVAQMFLQPRVAATGPAREYFVAE